LTTSDAVSRVPLSARLELATKIVVGIAAIAYAIGVLLVSFDLAKYKVSNFSLARPQYVLAGAVWLVSTVVAVGLPFLAALLTKFGDFQRRGRFARIYFAVVAVPLCGFFLSSLIEWVTLSDRDFQKTLYTTLAATVFFIFAWACLPSKKEMDAAADEKREVPLVPSGMGFAVIALFFWTLAYNLSVFPNIEPSLGGGKHPMGRVVFCQPIQGEELELKAMLGDLKTDKPLIVVLVDADFVVLADTKGVAKESPEEFHHGIRKVLMTPLIEYKTVLIKKSLVASIQYE